MRYKQKSQQKYVIAWEEKYPTFIVDLISHATVKFPNIIGNDIEEYLTFIEHTDHVIGYYSKKSYKRIQQEHGKYFLSKNKTEKLIRKYKLIINKHKTILKQIRSLNLSDTDDKNLQRIWQNLSEHLIEMVAYFRATRPEVEELPTQIIKKILSQNYSTTEVNNNFRIIATSNKLGLIEREKRDWVKILELKKINKKRLENILLEHINKYPSFFINVYDINKIIRILEKKILREKNDLNALKKEIKEQDKFIKELPNRQKIIIKQCKNNKELILLSKMLREFGWYRFEVKNLWAGAEINFLPLFYEIIKRSKIDLYNFFNYYTFQDISDLISRKSKLSDQEVKKRQKCIAIIVNNGKYEVATGSQAYKLLQKVQKNLVIEKEVKGTTAYPGFVKGQVKIIFPDNLEKTKNNFKTGEVLVTTNTQPSMVPIIRKASAIINDVGGITSHAAIVSREFKIPCIVGTKTATKILKDGDIVEVNADKGLVKIVQ